MADDYRVIVPGGDPGTEFFAVLWLKVLLGGNQHLCARIEGYWSVYGITDIGSVSLSLGQRNEDGLEIAAEIPVEIVIPGVSAELDTTGTEVYNDSGLRIVTKGVLDDPSDYGADLYVLLLAENNSGKTLTINDVYDSLSVNGYMTEYSYYSQELEDGGAAALVIQLWESSLEENRISSPSDIQEIEVGLEIKEGYTAIDEPTVKLAFGEQN